MNLQHHFLIAMPALQDPIFRRSVVYICEYNDDGAMGIIINKPLENLQVEGILEKLKITPDPRDPSIRLDKPVMLGGPLAEDRGFILTRHPRRFPQVFVSLTTPSSQRRAMYWKPWAPRGSQLTCWLRWVTHRGRKANWSRKFSTTPGSPRLPISIFCLKRRSPIAGATRQNSSASIYTPCPAWRDMHNERNFSRL